ncbi:proteasome inhibitor PI31 subunit [Coccinella septempunctata]|uniref:proteasome inhibitor PI31 subunit n=1 Tax=Coccinella septempunctata TaxID=41139 RepID=UPI001D08DB5D|nr:proteasome inhibitor PI31 subunit [Coccinella septempunctata]
MAENPFGWDLLFSGIKNDIRNNQDLLIGLVHYTLVSNGFNCIGLGESKHLTGDEPKSETLPEGWTDHYTIRYTYQGVLYNLKGTNLDDAIMVNLIRVDERNVSFVQLNTRSVVKRSGPLNEMIPEYTAMIDVIKKQLIDKVIVSKKNRESSTQTQPSTTPHRWQQSLTSNSPSNSNNALYENRDYRESFGHFMDPVGRNDLDPFGVGVDPLRIGRPNRPSGGGGMLFTPPGAFGPTHPLPPGLPPGAVPPGARFDPFRPPETDRWSGRRNRRPDNDEFMPPGYDDMFM